MTPRASLQRRIKQLEKTAEETITVGELHEFLAQFTAIALTYMTPEHAEAALDEILLCARPETQVTFLDQVHSATLELPRASA
jgi:hypothetical protein